MSSASGPRPSHAPRAAPLARLDRALDRPGGTIVVAMIAAYAALYLTLCALKYRGFLYKDFDLAIFVQALEGLGRGQTFGSIRGMSWLGDHSSLILFALEPLWMLFRHPYLLLAVQTVALALGAWPVYGMARRLMPGGLLPVTAAALYLLFPAVGYSNLFEFHPETLATPALLAALEAFHAGRLRGTLGWSATALACREDVALAVLGLALLAAMPHRPRRVAFAGALTALAVASMALTFGILKPAFNAGQADYGRMYAAWGPTPLAALRHLLTHPIEALAALVNTPGNPGDSLAKRQYPLHLLLPVLGLPLLAPAALLPALPIVLEHLWSERRHQHAIVFHYTALVTPFVIGAAVLGMSRAAAWLGERRRAIAIAALAASMLANFLFGPVGGRRIFQRVPPNEPILSPEYDATLRPYRERMLARLPRAGGVVAGFEFLARLAVRDSVYSMHHLTTGRYTYSDQPYPTPAGLHAVLADMAAQMPNLRPDTGERLRRMLADNDLRLVDAAGSLLLFERGARDTVEWIARAPARPESLASFVLDRQLAFFGADPLPDSVERGGLIPIRTAWRRIGPSNRSYRLLIQVYREGEFRAAMYGRVRPIGYGLWPVPDWPENATIVETYRLDASIFLGPGLYRVAMIPIAVDSLNRDQTLEVAARPGNEDGEVIHLGTIRVVERRTATAARR